MPPSIKKSAGRPADVPFLLALAKANLSKTDAGIARLNRLLSTPSGIDRTLNLLYYLTTFLAPQLSRLAFLLTVKLPTPIPLVVLTPASSTITLTSNRLRTLASRISDVRMFLRLWGLLGIYDWGASTLRNPPKDPVVKALVLGQVVVNAGFQVLENLAYLNKHALLGFSKKTEGKFWVWSTRCWVAHIVLEFIRLERVRGIKSAKGKALALVGEEEKKARKSWQKAWVTNAANAPLALHWSTSTGLISDTAVGSFGLVGAFIGLRDAWRGTAA